MEALALNLVVAELRALVQANPTGRASRAFTGSGIPAGIIQMCVYVFIYIYMYTDIYGMCIYTHIMCFIRYSMYIHTYTNITYIYTYIIVLDQQRGRGG